MKRTKWLALALCGMVLLGASPGLALGQAVRPGRPAAASANYRLDWAAAGDANSGPSSSAGFRLNTTIGQAGAATLSTSPGFNLCAGFQCAPGLGPSAWTFLPLVRR